MRASNNYTTQANNGNNTRGHNHGDTKFSDIIDEENAYVSVNMNFFSPHPVEFFTRLS